VTGSGRYADDVAFAREIAEAAGRLQLERYERVGAIQHKSPKDVVTEVDHLSEDLILRAIRERFPGDGILAEESGAHRAPTGRGSHGAAVGSPAASGGSPAASGGSPAPTSAPPAAAPRGGSNSSGGSTSTAPGRDLAHGRTWIIDPLDGTVNYANGIPFFCVSVGLVVDGTPAAGVVHDPMRAETFWATSDGPACLGDNEIHASDKQSLADFVVSLALGGRRVATRARTVRKAIRVSRNMGSAALALVYVANGRFDAFVQSGGMSAWDVAAAGLIAERAGALVTDTGGGPWFDVDKATRMFGLVAAPVAHHAELLRLAA
jgi:fructose-1,6-bisphosphatase/inositol monophosphatase family enzyme